MCRGFGLDTLIFIIRVFYYCIFFFQQSERAPWNCCRRRNHCTSNQKSCSTGNRSSGEVSGAAVLPTRAHRRTTSLPVVTTIKVPTTLYTYVIILKTTKRSSTVWRDAIRFFFYASIEFDIFLLIFCTHNRDITFVSFTYRPRSGKTIMNNNNNEFSVFRFNNIYIIKLY